MQRLQGRVILVAGAGRIGGTLARRYAKEGAQVVLADIDLQSAEAVVNEITQEGALPILLKRGGGSIVYTSSAAAYSSGSGQVAYAMSKSAGHALMRHVAQRFGADGIRANTIAPALTLPEEFDALLPPEFVDMAKSGASIKSRIGRPTDVAAMGALLLSDEGSYITGQVINIDGGTIMRA